MEIDFEREISQNALISSWGLWACAVRFHEEVKGSRGIPFPQMFIVLPLLLHQKSAGVIKGKTMVAGSFYRALGEDRTLVVGLQERLQGHAWNTLRALNLSFASELLRLDRDTLQIYPGLRKLPNGAVVSSLPEDVQQVINAGRRVGYWLAETEFDVICSLLKIRY
jgi:hypothetical protein